MLQGRMLSLRAAFACARRGKRYVSLGARTRSSNERRMSLDPTKDLVGRRILIVEDEPLLADEIMDELQGIGAVPIGPAPSVDVALQALADGVIGPVILPESGL